MAMKEDGGLIEKHVEKIVLGVAIVILLVVGLHWGMESPRRIKIKINAPGVNMPQEEYSPDKVDDAMKTASDKLVRRMDKLKPVVIPVPDYEKLLKEIYETPYDTDLVQDYCIYDLEQETPRIDKGVKTVEPTSLAVLTPLPRPEKPLVNACREVQVGLTPDGEVTHKEININHIAAVFEHGKVLEKWKKALEKTYIPARVTFVAVEAHRRHLLTDGSWSKSEPVAMVIMPRDPELPLPVIPEADGKNLLIIQQKCNELSLIENQEQILEPPCPDIVWSNRETGTWQIQNHKPRTRVSGLLELEDTTPGTSEKPDEHRLTSEEARRREKVKRLLEAKRREETKRRRRTVRPPSREREERRGERSEERRRTVRPPRRERIEDRRERPERDEERRRDDRRIGPGRRPVVAGPDAPEIILIPTLQEQLNNPAGILEVWFHDTSLKEGMTYSYRLRLVLVNPLLGRFDEVTNKDNAKVRLLRTPWTQWSEPVSVKRPTEFFLVGSAPQMGTVTVEVFTQRWGQRVSHSFRIGQGEPIGENKRKDLFRLGGGEQEETLVNFKTGAIAVSFNFKKKQRIPGTDFSRTTTELLYLDANGKLRTVTQDDSSPRYKELRNEVLQTIRTVSDVP